MKRINFFSLAVGVLVGFIVFLLGYRLATSLVDIQIVSTVLGIVFGLAAIGFLAYPGFEALPEVSQSILSVAGLRIKQFVFSEGPAWRIPFVSRFLTESTKIVTFDFPDLQCMSSDNQQVTINGAVQCRITDINTALEISDFKATLMQVYENALRIAAHGKKAEELPGSKQWIAKLVRNGGSIPQPTSEDPSATVELPGLDSAVLALGRTIVSLTITEIALSEEYRKSLEAKTLEQVQAKAEGADTDTLISNFEKAYTAMAKKGVPGGEILAALQARRGLSKNISVSGGTPIERAAAMIADGFSGKTENTVSPPQPQGSGVTKPRRRS